MMTTKSGYCAIMGPTNAGKSTLLNTMIGQKVSIVSRKVQTTRCRITGIFTQDDTQIVFVDTPGLFDPGRPLERAMIDEVWRALDDVDVILYVMDASSPNLAAAENGLRSIIQKKRDDQPLIVALNKVDAVHPKEKLLTLAASIQKIVGSADVFMIAGEKGHGVHDVIKVLSNHMQTGPFFYPPDQTRDVTHALMAAEITREHIFDRLHQELPYQIMVETLAFDGNKEEGFIIDQNIIVARDNHRGMVVGKGGQTLKQIGSAARRDLMDMLDARVRLNIRVIVDEDWMQKPQRLQAGGLLRSS